MFAGPLYRTGGPPVPHTAARSGNERIRSRRKLAVFVAMSFRTDKEQHLTDYFRAIKRAADRAGGIEVRRVDLLDGDYEVSQKLMCEIDRADVVLADFTLNSRNVYFELGYARGRRKDVIQTARERTVLEFDIRQWRTLFYRNATELEEKLVYTFRAMRNSRPHQPG
jgi:hypothetical protein